MEVYTVTQRVGEGKPTTLQSQLSYGGRVFNDQKLHNTNAPLPKLATKLVELLGEEDSDRPMALAIEDITYGIRNQGGDIDSAMAKFAVQAYAARNQVCHGGAGHLVIAEKWDDLAQRISLDLEALPEIFPEGREQSLPQDSHMQEGTQPKVGDKASVHNTARLLYNEKSQTN